MAGANWFLGREIAPASSVSTPCSRRSSHSRWAAISPPPKLYRGDACANTATRGETRGLNNVTLDLHCETQRASACRNAETRRAASQVSCKGRHKHHRQERRVDRPQAPRTRFRLMLCLKKRIEAPAIPTDHRRARSNARVFSENEVVGARLCRKSQWENRFLRLRRHGYCMGPLPT